MSEVESEGKGDKIRKSGDEEERKKAISCLGPIIPEGLSCPGSPVWDSSCLGFYHA
jgi:hypothetical protein